MHERAAWQEAERLEPELGMLHPEKKEGKDDHFTTVGFHSKMGTY